MRTIGILAIFVLALCAIGEGAALFRLSRQVSDLKEQVARAPVEESDDPAPRPRVVLPASAPRAREAAPRPVPAFTAPAPATSAPAVGSLRDALATAEGRDQLKAALAIIDEEKRQDRLVKRADKRNEGEQKWKDRILKAVPLTGDEPLRIEALFASLKTGRQQILDDMRAGAKNSEQADNEIDQLQDATEKNLRTLLGDDRWKKLRGEDRRGGRRPDQAPQPPNGAQAQPPKPLAIGAPGT